MEYFYAVWFFIVTVFYFLQNWQLKKEIKSLKILSDMQ